MEEHNPAEAVVVGSRLHEGANVPLTSSPPVPRTVAPKIRPDSASTRISHTDTLREVRMPIWHRLLMPRTADVVVDVRPVPAAVFIFNVNESRDSF
jgi:hypothetical protein